MWRIPTTMKEVAPTPRLVLAAAFVLLALASVHAYNFPVAMSAPTADESPAFAPATAEANLTYLYQGTDSFVRGMGIFVADYDNDGWPDVLLTGGTAERTETGWSGRRPTLFENVGGEFRVSGAIPAEAIAHRVVVSAAFVDYDVDGWPDLVLLPAEGRPVLLHNDRGSYRVVPDGLPANLSEPIAAAAADYDRDGCPDLFVAQNGEWSDRTPAGYDDPNRTVQADNGNLNVLFRGTCSGFERVEDAGIEGERWSLATSFVDFTGDGYPDIHVANDYNTDVLYVNRGNGTFERRELGPATDRNAMSSEVADVNGDGRLDVFVTNIHFDLSNVSSPAHRTYIHTRIGQRARGNNLLVNRGNGTFVDRASAYDVREGGWGWAAVVADLDNDGDRDLFHATKKFEPGFSTSRVTRYPAVFERRPNGFNARNASRLGFRALDGMGVARLDYDRDGDLDLLVGPHTIDKPVLYENRGDAGNWLRIDLRNPGPGNALGAEVWVTADGQTQHRMRNSRTDFLSQESRILHIGLGDASQVERVRVVWPDGATTTVQDVRAGRLLCVTPDGVNQSACS